jgi:hypothetical protein
VIRLGDKMRDVVTLQEGVVTVKAEHLTGCTRYWLQPQGLDEKGKSFEGEWVDAARLELVMEGAVKLNEQQAREVYVRPAPSDVGAPAARLGAPR